MGRIRSIKPEFPHSESIGRLSRDARLLFVQLWTIVDDEGRARAASRMLASLLYPYDDDAGELIDAWLAELEANGMIRRYEVDGSRYLEIINWLKHQKIDKPSKSKLPAFDEASRTLANPRKDSTTDLGPRIRDLGSDDDGDARATASETPADEPKREPLISSEAFALADAVIEACGLDPGNPPPEWCGLPYRLQSGLASGWSGELDVLPTVKRIMQNRTGPPTSPKYFEKAIADAHASRLAPVPIGKPETPRENAKPNLVAIALGVGADAAARSRVGRGPHSDAGRLLPKRESG